MPISEATAQNLRRKSAYVDEVQVRDGSPMFSWVELNLTELCNRLCPFCPRIDPAVYPNQPLHMQLGLVEKIVQELAELDYKGVIVLCGFGEPLLHPAFFDVVRTLKGGTPSLSNVRPGWRLELVTNGDRLTAGMIRTLQMLGLDYFVVSLYDGPEQVEKFKTMFAEAGVQRPEDVYILRDRWHSAADSFGLKLTNRAGTIDVGQQDPVDATRPCQYLTYQLTIDWNGDVLLCPQDWHKRARFGNVGQQPLWAVWTSRTLHKRRMALLRGREGLSPCDQCNTDGCLHGHNHVPVWSGATP